jgi:glycosyltransferase involved in cell wall biosynthesis
LDYKIAQKLDFTVVIPNLNSMMTIKDTLDSASKAARAYDSNLIEIVLVDNGSCDDSLRIIEAWLKSNPDIKLKLIQEPCPGNPGLARNVGLLNSESQNILFLDSDDCLHADVFAILNANINKDTDLIIFNYEVRQSSLTPPTEKIEILRLTVSLN